MLYQHRKNCSLKHLLIISMYLYLFLICNFQKIIKHKNHFSALSPSTCIRTDNHCTYEASTLKDCRYAHNVHTGILKINIDKLTVSHADSHRGPRQMKEINPKKSDVRAQDRSKVRPAATTVISTCTGADVVPYKRWRRPVSNCAFDSPSRRRHAHPNRTALARLPICVSAVR